MEISDENSEPLVSPYGMRVTSSSVTLTYGVAFWTGLTIVTATATSDITVSFQ